MADTTTEITVVRDWDFEVNLSGLQAPTGKGGNVLPTGYYKVQLTDLYVNPDKNASRVIIKATVSEGPYAGAVRSDGLGLPKSDEDKVRYYWRGLAESAGYTASQLDAGSVKLGIGTFKGRTAHMYFVTKEESDDGYEDITWLAPMEWAQQKQNFESQDHMPAQPAKPAAAQPAARGSALGSTSPAKIENATPLGGAGAENAVRRSALLTQLGVE